MCFRGTAGESFDNWRLKEQVLATFSMAGHSPSSGTRWAQGGVSGAVPGMPGLPSWVILVELFEASSYMSCSSLVRPWESKMLWCCRFSCVTQKLSLNDRNTSQVLERWISLLFLKMKPKWCLLGKVWTREYSRLFILWRIIGLHRKNITEL